MSDIDAVPTLTKILSSANRLTATLGRNDLALVEAINALLDEIESLRAQLSQQIPDGFISIEEKLPDNHDERVLALETDGEVYRCYYKNGKWLDIDNYELLAVHAWMPFPSVAKLAKF